MLDALGFLNIRQKMVYNMCVFVYKIKNGMMPGYLSDEIKYINERHSYNIRQRNDIDIKFCKTRAGRNI